MRKKLIWICSAAVAFLVFGGALGLAFLACASRPRPAHFDASYTSANKGVIQIQIPEVYELANIAIAITDYGLNSRNAVKKEGEYYDRVREHFLAYKGHPLIAKIEFSKDNSFSRYYGFRENSARYVFEGEHIIPSGIYPKSWAWWSDTFKKYVQLVEDFARKSQFREFYKENLSSYEEQIQRYKETVPLRKIWAWLEKNFPQRYDTYKVIFSPLIGGSHSAQRCEGDGFREVIVFVSGPGISEGPSSKVREGLLSRVVFTEIDHNYVNPTTWDYWFRVAGAFHKIARWNRQSNYRNPIQTFNEYMTWSVFLLYARESHGDQDFEEIKRITVNTMVKGRKFILFEEFSNKLLDLYQHRNEGQTIPDLYPEILSWAEKAQSQIDKKTVP